jgi:hypothetical protein
MASFRRSSNKGKTKKMMIADPAYNSKENLVNGGQGNQCFNFHIARQILFLRISWVPA